MRLITFDDIIDIYTEIHLRDLGFIFAKINFSARKRTKATFNQRAKISADYWIIPAIRRRWNHKISGDPDTSYEDYFVRKFLQQKDNLKFLALGSGIASHEMAFARHGCFREVKCIDFSENKLKEARDIAIRESLHNMAFEPADINRYEFPRNTYDVVLFHSSLHHFKNVDSLLDKVHGTLRPGGFLLINEYVGPNRLQISREKIKIINGILAEIIPPQYRKRVKTGLIKNRVHGPGYLRMLFSDPSEAIESENILPAVRKKFQVVEEKNPGGDLTMLLFKDIAHHFTDDTEEKAGILNQVFSIEDQFLENKDQDSDFIFGVYRKNP